MEKLITAITGSSLTLHWQLHTSCCSASINLKWPATVPAQFNAKELKLVKKKVLKKLCKCCRGVHGFKIVQLGGQLAPPFLQISLFIFFSLYVFLYINIYIYTHHSICVCVCVCAYMHKRPRNVGIPELNFSYHLFIRGL